MLEITIDGTPYKFDQNKLMNTEIKAIQRNFGLSLEDFTGAMNLRNIDMCDAIVWLVRTRSGEKDLKPEDIEYDFAALEVRDLDAPAEVPDDAADPSEPSPSEPSPLTLDES